MMVIKVRWNNNIGETKIEYTDSFKKLNGTAKMDIINDIFSDLGKYEHDAMIDLGFEKEDER